MSSVYGPALLKNLAKDDGGDEAIGKKKNQDGEFETDHDRAKRIRKERKQQKEKDKEDTKKMQMSQAINSLLGGKKDDKAKSKGAPFAGAQFQSFGPPGAPAGPAGPPAGPAAGPSAGPAAGPSAGPAGPTAAGPGVAGPPGPSAGPAGPPDAAGPAGPPAAAEDGEAAEPSAEAIAPAGPPPRPRGPMRPAKEDLPEPSASAAPAEEPTGATQQKAKVGHMDHFAEQKRVSWDELKTKLANAAWKEEGVPGSNSFDSYAQKLEKTRNERLGAQEEETKRLLKHVNKDKGKASKKDKKDKKEKKQKGVKRTADGAILAQSDGESSSGQEDCLLARYKKKDA